MGVGFPNCLLLEDFGFKIYQVFGAFPYHVGSSLKEKSGWRDVDVRLLLDKEVFDKWEFGDLVDCRDNSKWKSLCEVFSIYGQKTTNLPIDFQIQETKWANETFPNSTRSCLGITKFVDIRGTK